MDMSTDRTTERADLQRPAPGTWVIDPVHSEIEFQVRHLMISKVRGRFREFSGTLLIDEVLERSSFDVLIKAASIDTGDAQRDAHIKGPEFLDVERYPDIRVRSTAVRPTGGAKGQVVGEATLRGVTRPVVIDVEYTGAAVDPWGKERCGFVGRLSVNREDFGITWNQALETGGFMLGKEISFELDVQAVRPSEGDS
jgi:polyisoprenoid-binding protein YceI